MGNFLPKNPDMDWYGSGRTGWSGVGLRILPREGSGRAAPWKEVSPLPWKLPTRCRPRCLALLLTGRTLASLLSVRREIRYVGAWGQGTEIEPSRPGVRAGQASPNWIGLWPWHSLELTRLTKTHPHADRGTQPFKSTNWQHSQQRGWTLIWLTNCCY